MTTPLPPLAAFEEKASILLEAYTTGSAEAMARLHEQTWHRRSWPTFRSYVQLDLGRRPDGPDDPVPITLDDARYLIARGHGFDSWQALAEFVTAPPARPVARPIRVTAVDGSREARTLARSRDLDLIVAELRRHARPGVAGEGQVTDEMLQGFAEVTTITALDLSGCKGVTDAGMAPLARLSALERLDLSGTSVTDDGQSSWLRVTPTLGINNGTQGNFNPGPLHLEAGFPGPDGRTPLYLTATATGLAGSVFYIGNIANAANLASRRNDQESAEVRAVLERKLLPELTP